MPVHSSPSTERDQLHFLLFAGLKADRGAGWDIEAHPISSGAVEIECVVHFEEMIVAAYLNGAVTCVAYQSARRGPACVQLNFAVIENVLPGMHFSSY